MTQNSDYTFYGGGGFGGINKPKVIKIVQVPVNVTPNPTTISTDSCVYKAKKSKRRVKVIKSINKKSNQIHRTKKRKSHKKSKLQKYTKPSIVSKKVRFQNF